MRTAKLSGARERGVPSHRLHRLVVEFAGVGHAPALMSDAQIRAVKEFLQRD